MRSMRSMRRMRTMGKALAAGVLALLLCVGMLGCAEQEKENETSAFAVVSNEATVALGDDAEAVLSKLGEPQETREVFDCGAGNSRTYYRFASLELYTMKTDDGETVDQIEINDDLVTTSRGICIGDTVTKVQETYGNPSSEENGQITYSKDGKHLVFRIEGDTVSDIALIRETA